MLLAYTLVAALLTVMGVAMVKPPAREVSETGSRGIPVSAGSPRIGGRPNTPDQAGTFRSPVSLTVRTAGLYRGHPAEYWAARFRRRTRQLQAVKARLRARWTPTVDYALRLASAVYGVPYGELRSVAACESRLYPFAVNGQYKGIFQMHWLPFGFSPFDPVASALSAAATVVHDGGWRQWECRP